jgi:hypothetical protein
MEPKEMQILGIPFRTIPRKRSQLGIPVRAATKNKTKLSECRPEPFRGREINSEQNAAAEYFNNNVGVLMYRQIILLTFIAAVS